MFNKKEAITKVITEYKQTGRQKEIQDKYKNYIDLIVETYRKYEPFDLVKMTTFDGGAWDCVYDNGSGNKRCIPIKLIQKDAITNGLMQ